MISVRYEGEVHELNLGDLADIEDACGGVPIGGLLTGDASAMSARTMLAIAWVARRKVYPDATLEEARRESADVLDALLVTDDEEGAVVPPPDESG